MIEGVYDLLVLGSLPLRLFERIDDEIGDLDNDLFFYFIKGEEFLNDCSLYDFS